MMPSGYNKLNVMQKSCNVMSKFLKKLCIFERNDLTMSEKIQNDWSESHDKKFRLRLRTSWTQLPWERNISISSFNWPVGTEVQKHLPEKWHSHFEALIKFELKLTNWFCLNWITIRTNNPIYRLFPKTKLKAETSELKSENLKKT